MCRGEILQNRRSSGMRFFHRTRSAGRTYPLRARQERQASGGGAAAAAAGCLPLTAFSRNQARGDDAARRATSEGVFRRAARKDGARRHYIAPDQREGALRLPKNFFKKRKDAEEGIFCGAVSQQARASIPADRTALRPHRHGGGTPARFFCAENPNRLTCFSQRPARGAVVRRCRIFHDVSTGGNPNGFVFKAEPS